MDDAGNSRNTADNELNVSKSSVELVKLLENFLHLVNGFDLNVKIDNMYGDIYSGNSSNKGAGRNNTYNIPDYGAYSQNNFGSAVTNGSVNLSDNESIYNYLCKNRNTPQCAFLISLAIFDVCQYEVVIKEAQILYEKYILNNIPYSKKTRNLYGFEASRLELKKLFGVEYVKGQAITKFPVEVDYVKFSLQQHAYNVLECVFNETIGIKNAVTDFLIYLVTSDYMVLYSNAITAIKKIGEFISHDSLAKIINALIKKETIASDLAVAHILGSLPRLPDRQYNPETFLENFLYANKNIHYHIASLTLCKLLHCKKDVIKQNFSPVLDALINQPELEIILEHMNMVLPEEENYINNISLFYNIGNRYAEYFIALVENFAQQLRGTKRFDEHRNLILMIVLLFFKEDLNESCVDVPADSDSFSDMLFIRLVLRKDIELRKNIIYLWSELIKSNIFGKECKKILKSYLLKRDGNIKDDVEQRKLNLFFKSFSYDQYAYKRVIDFLARLSTERNGSLELAKIILNTIGGR